MKTIQEIRVALDARVQDVKKLGRTRELSLALTTLEQGRMLLGKTLGLLDKATPYPESCDPASPVVEKPADTAAGYVPDLPGDAIADVKQVRGALETVLVRLAELRIEGWPRNYGTLAEVVFDAAYVQLTLSKMWLGMQLSRLAEELEAKAPTPETIAAN